MKMSTRQIAIAGVLSAISIFLGVTRLGFIPFFAGASITIMHIPVILGAILEGPLVGTIIGAIFGIFSLVQAAIAPTGVVDPAFQDPLVSVLPRLFIGVVTWAVYRAVRPVNELLALALAAAAGTLTNTVLVLGMLALRQYYAPAILWTVGITNAPFEVAAAIIISIAVITAWKRIEFGRKGADL